MSSFSVVHKSNNPDLPIKFRYCTCGVVFVEINMWNWVTRVEARVAKSHVTYRRVQAPTGKLEFGSHIVTKLCGAY